MDEAFFEGPADLEEREECRAHTSKEVFSETFRVCDKIPPEVQRIHARLSLIPSTVFL